MPSVALISYQVEINKVSAYTTCINFRECKTKIYWSEAVNFLIMCDVYLTATLRYIV